jgi:hypothetical protein
MYETSSRSRPSRAPLAALHESGLTVKARQQMTRRVGPASSLAIDARNHRFDKPKLFEIDRSGRGGGIEPDARVGVHTCRLHGTRVLSFSVLIRLRDFADQLLGAW